MTVEFRKVLKTNTMYGICLLQIGTLKDTTATPSKSVTEKIKTTDSVNSSTPLFITDSCKLTATNQLSVSIYISNRKLLRYLSLTDLEAISELITNLESATTSVVTEEATLSAKESEIITKCKS